MSSSTRGNTRRVRLGIVFFFFDFNDLTRYFALQYELINTVVSYGLPKVRKEFPGGVTGAGAGLNEKSVGIVARKKKF